MVDRSKRMIDYIDYTMKVTVSDGGVFLGALKAFDTHMNLILGDCCELKGVRKDKRRELGLVVLRGETLVSMTIESTPCQERECEKKVSDSHRVGSKEVPEANVDKGTKLTSVNESFPSAFDVEA